MIRHLVLLRFRPDVTAAEKTALMDEVSALRGHLPGMLSFARLANVSPEHPVVQGFLDGIVIDFTGRDARDAYLVDPAHQAVGAKLTAACEGGAAGIVVFDHAL